MPSADSASFKIRAGLGEPGFNGHDAYRVGAQPRFGQLPTSC